MTEDTIDQVRQLSQWLSGTDIALLELSSPGKLIRLQRNGSAMAGSARPVAWMPGQARLDNMEEPSTVVRAGSVGIVLHAHPLREDPLVRVGQQVSAGQAVLLLKIGVVLLAVCAPRAGVVRRIVAPDRSVVGFGDPLLELG